MDKPEDAGHTPQRKMWQELRTAVRFPLHLPAMVLADGKQLEAVTINVSTGGILLRLAEPLSAVSTLEFLLEIPKDGSYGEVTAAIHCAGHVIRSFEQDGFWFVAAIIDEYRFQ